MMGTGGKWTLRVHPSGSTTSTVLNSPAQHNDYDVISPVISNLEAFACWENRNDDALIMLSSNGFRA